MNQAEELLLEIDNAGDAPARHLQRIPIDRLLVWVYQKQKPHKVEVGCTDLHKRVVSQFATFSDRAALGTRIDGGQHKTAVIHPDADMIHDVVRLYDYCGMVMYHAETDTTPDWMPGARAEYKAARRSNGKIKMLYDKNRNGIACVVDVICSLENISFHRKMYNEWWESMLLIVWELRNQCELTSYYPLLPFAPEKPWLC